MAGDRVLTLFNLVVVLALAWWASREELGMGIAVAVVGLAAVYFWSVFGLAAAVAMTAAVLWVPGPLAVIGMAVVVIMLAATHGQATRGHRTLPQSGEYD
jgi:hypothetical protein